MNTGGQGEDCSPTPGRLQYQMNTLATETTLH